MPCQKSIQVRKIAPEGLANISGQFLSGCLFLLMRSHIKKKPDDSKKWMSLMEGSASDERHYVEWMRTEMTFG